MKRAHDLAGFILGVVACIALLILDVREETAAAVGGATWAAWLFFIGPMLYGAGE